MRPLLLALVLAGLAAAAAEQINGSTAVYVFGSNDDGQLGLGDTTDRKSPVKLPLSEAAAQVALGYAHTAVRTVKGNVYVFGYNADGELGLGDTTIRKSPTIVDGLFFANAQLSLGVAHTAVLQGECVASRGTCEGSGLAWRFSARCGGGARDGVCGCAEGAAPVDGVCRRCPFPSRCAGFNCSTGYAGVMCMQCSPRYYSVRGQCNS